MFLNTIGHHSDKIITAALITTTDIGTNCGDLRGKHPKKHGITEEQRAFMKRHIRSFKPQISHYGRAHAPNRLYLPCVLTITEMYVDYVEECKKDEQRCLSYVSYTRELKSQNISFAKLGNEECEICDEHQLHVVANDVQTRRNDESEDVERVKKNGKIKKQNKIERRICDKVICDKCSLW